VRARSDRVVDAYGTKRFTRPKRWFGRRSYVGVALTAAVLALAGSGPASAAVTVPGAPRSLAATPGEGMVTLSWAASAGEPSGYYVWRRGSDGSWNRIASTSATTLTYSDAGLTTGMGFTYGIRAYNELGVSSSSSLVSAVPLAPPAPAPRCGAGNSRYQGLISSTPGLAGYWRLGELAGTSACEVTGRSDGAYRGGSALGASGALSGDSDTAARFDGSTGYVSVAHKPSLSLGDSFTVEAWVKRASLGGGSNQVIASKQGRSWALMFDPRNRLVLRRPKVAAVATSNTAVLDTTRWHHVVATKAGGSVHLYIDGAEVTGRVSNQTMVDNAKPLVIGQTSDAAFFRGAIDEVAVYAGPLTPSQVIDHYRAGSDPVIAAAGDIACASSESPFNGGLGTATHCRQQYTSDLLVQSNLSAVLPLGDGQHWTGTLADYARSYDPTWGRLKAISRPVPGNHDYESPGASGYFDYFNGSDALTGPAGERGKGWYSYDVGTWHVIALNSECAEVGGCGAGSPQEQWLRADLAAHQARCTLAYWHRPLFNSGWTGNAPEMRQFWQDLYEAGADVVLNSHAHDYERFAPQTPTGEVDAARGIRQFVAGTGGQDLHSLGMIQPNSESVNVDTFGVLKLQLHAGAYDWQFVPEAGRSFTDSGSASCH
jgi:hypothetical protein